MVRDVMSEVRASPGSRLVGGEAQLELPELSASFQWEWPEGHAARFSVARGNVGHRSTSVPLVGPDILAQERGCEGQA